MIHCVYEAFNGNRHEPAMVQEIILVLYISLAPQTALNGTKHSLSLKQQG